MITCERPSSGQEFRTSCLSTNIFTGTVTLVVKGQKRQNEQCKSTSILYPLGNDMSQNEITKQRYVERHQ